MLPETFTSLLNSMVWVGRARVMDVASGGGGVVVMAKVSSME